MNLSEWRKLDEIPTTSSAEPQCSAACNERPLMITKGALSSVLGVCSQVETKRQRGRARTNARPIRDLQARLEGSGSRTLGVAVREMAPGTPRSLVRTKAG